MRLVQGEVGGGNVSRDRLIAYIDGFNLYNGIHDEWKCAQLWLDVVQLVKDLRPRSDLVAVKYFTAYVRDDERARARQRDYIAALQAANPGVLHISLGRFQTKTRACRECGATYRAYEEKETDVNIAVELVSDAAQHRMDSALLISADSDLAPAVRAARAANPALFVVAAFPPNRYSAELEKLMPASFHIGRSKITGAQLPEIVTASGGRTHSRPAKWGGRSRAGHKAT
nr:MAG: NYN domain-containing protein [Actinomycetota bacterium]